MLNARKEEKCLKDLQFLKDQSDPGPFICKDDVRKFMKLCGDEKEKIQRMCIEVRYFFIYILHILNKKIPGT